MSLARVWTRQLFGASGVALLVPATIACALVILALAGGFARLGAIGQALSGPAVPPGPSAGAPGPAGHAAERLRVALATLGTVAAPAIARGAGLAAGGPAAGRARPGSGSGGSRGAGGSGSGPGGSRGPGGSGGASPGSGGPRGSGAGGTGTTPPTAPTLVDGVVSLGTSVTARLPGPAGSVATTTLQSLGATLNRVLPLPTPAGVRSPPPPPGTSSAPTSSGASSAAGSAGASSRTGSSGASSRTGSSAASSLLAPLGAALPPATTGTPSKSLLP